MILTSPIVKLVIFILELNLIETAKIYTYSYQSAGIEKVERLKKLARAGNGLNCYIKLYVNSLYEK